MALFLSIDVLTVIDVSVGELENAFAMSFSQAILANIRCPIRPDGPSVAMAAPLTELAFEKLPYRVDYNAWAVPLPVLIPVTFVLIFVCVN